MKKIEAIIRPFKLDDVRNALGDKIHGMSVMEMKGFGRQRGHSEVYRGAEYKIDFVPKIRLEIICKDEEAENLIAIICESARTGKIGDGKIFLSDVQDIIRIRTGERGEAVI
ncbi:MAG: family nitrogen regulator [Fibrobacteres bacterium]|nr:family nitrogen regulator [Fibrobacterota bacterium]